MECGGNYRANNGSLRMERRSCRWRRRLKLSPTGYGCGARWLCFLCKKDCNGIGATFAWIGRLRYQRGRIVAVSGRTERIGSGPMKPMPPARLVLTRVKPMPNSPVL